MHKFMNSFLKIIIITSNKHKLPKPSRHLSGLKFFPAMLNRCSTAAEDAGIPKTSFATSAIDGYTDRWSFQNFRVQTYSSS